MMLILQILVLMFSTIKAWAVYARDAIKLSSDLSLLKAQMYSSSNLQEVCLNLFKGLIELNLKYIYLNCRDPSPKKKSKNKG